MSLMIISRVIAMLFGLTVASHVVANPRHLELPAPTDAREDRDLRRVSLRVTSAVSDAVIETVARLALPSSLTIPPGESPEPLIRNRCGAYTKTYERIFIEANPGIRLGPVEEAREVVLPACLRWSNKTKVALLPNDTLEVIINREIGVSPNAIIIPCQENERSSRCGKSAGDLVRELNPGIDVDSLRDVQSLVLPITTSWTTLTFTPERIENLAGTPLATLPFDEQVKGEITSRTRYMDPWLPNKSMVSRILGGANSAIGRSLAGVLGNVGQFDGADMPASEQETDALIHSGELAQPIPPVVAAAVNLTADAAILGSSAGPEVIDLIKPVDIETGQVTDTACLDASQVGGWPLILDGIKTAFSISIAEAKERGLFEEKGSNVLIVDTGITRVNELFGKREIFINERERDIQDGGLRDNDNNRYNNDRIGIDADRGGNPDAPKDYERYLHGTQVAVLAVGGPLRGKISELEGMVRLRFAKVVRVMGVTNGKRNIRVSTDGLSDAISYAGRNDFPIANVSIAASSPLVAVEDALRNNADLLLVVAAGNEKALLDIVASYPAAYGGREGAFRNQVISVAAHDLNGNVPAFSNKSISYVDIAAPGCDMLYATENNETQHLFGTSFAAPLVTFTAAVLRTLGLRGPREIKDRIINASDFDREKLENNVSSGGRLNIAKALYIFSDVLEMASDGKTMLGTWKREGELKCKDRPSVAEARISKITQVTSSPALRLRYVWRDSQGNEPVVDCEPLGNGIMFQFAGAPAAELVSWSKIRDLVPAVFPPRT